jgi:hypothetical protein
MTTILIPVYLLFVRAIERTVNRSLTDRVSILTSDRTIQSEKVLLPPILLFQKQNSKRHQGHVSSGSEHGILSGSNLPKPDLARAIGNLKLPVRASVTATALAIAGGRMALLPRAHERQLEAMRGNERQ